MIVSTKIVKEFGALIFFVNKRRTKKHRSPQTFHNQVKNGKGQKKGEHSSKSVSIRGLF